MAHGITHIPFDEFSRNPGKVLERVVRKKERVIVQTAAGEPALLAPVGKTQPMTLEEAYGSVSPLERPENFKKLREVVREERVEKFR